MVGRPLPSSRNKTPQATNVSAEGLGKQAVARGASMPELTTIQALIAVPRSA